MGTLLGQDGLARKGLLRARGLVRYGWALARPSLARPFASLRGRLVQVENTSFCNFRCAYCPTHAPSAEPGAVRGHMPLDTFERILREERRARVVVVQGQGEPFLDPTLFEKLALARARGLATQVITNGSRLDGPTVARLGREGPDVLLVSLDAVSAEENVAARAGLAFDEVCAGVQALTAARRRMTRPMAIGLLSIVRRDFDATVESALRGFEALGVDVLFYKEANPAYVGRIRDYRPVPVRGAPKAVRRSLGYAVVHQRVARVAPCPQLRFGFRYYLWDGSSTPCCVLSHPRHAAAEYRRERLLERYAKRDAPPECERCTFFAGYPRERAR